ncbi:MAG: hypothetical protein JWM11_6882, partial [Planctomycetaceae bacterium]|nr:hypothetical protein [Planctomycetaceae bacterium]
MKFNKQFVVPSIGRFCGFDVFLSNLAHFPGKIPQPTSLIIPQLSFVPSEECGGGHFNQSIEPGGIDSSDFKSLRSLNHPGDVSRFFGRPLLSHFLDRNSS